MCIEELYETQVMESSVWVLVVVGLLNKRVSYTLVGECVGGQSLGTDSRDHTE